MDIDEIAAGHSLHAISRLNSTVSEKFRGQMIKMLFNDYDVLKNAKRKNRMNGHMNGIKSREHERYKVRNRYVLSSSVINISYFIFVGEINLFEIFMNVLLLFIAAIIRQIEVIIRNTLKIKEITFGNRQL